MANENKVTLSGRFWFFIVIAAAVNITQFMSNGSVPVAVASTGASAGTIGLVSSIMGIVSFMIMVIAGPMSCTIAPHKLWGFACFGYAISYFLLSRGVISLYILGKAIDGFVTGFQGPAMMMLLRDCVGQNNVSSAMGIFQMRNSVAKVVGPMLGLNGLCILLGYTENFLVCSCLMICYGIIVLSSMKMKNTEFKPVPFKLNPQTIVVKGGWIPLFIVMCVGMVQMGMGNFNTVFAKTELGATNIGLMMSTGNLFAIFVAPVITGFADRISVKKMLIIAFLIFACGPIIYSLATSFYICIVAAVFQYVGFAVLAGVLMGLLVKRAPAHLSGVAGNTYSGGLNLGSFLGPLLAGQMAQYLGYRTMFRCMLIPIVVAIVLVFIYCAQNPGGSTAEQ